MELTAVRHFRKRRDVKRFEDEILQPFENARVQETVPFRLDPHRVTCGEDIDKLARIFPLAARDDLQRPNRSSLAASYTRQRGRRLALENAFRSEACTSGFRGVIDRHGGSLYVRRPRPLARRSS
jgi:hypothetical protein